MEIFQNFIIGFIRFIVYYLTIIGIRKIFYRITDKFFRESRIKFSYQYVVFPDTEGPVSFWSPTGYDIRNCEIFYAKEDFRFKFSSDNGDFFIMELKMENIPFSFLKKLLKHVLYHMIFIPKSYKKTEDYFHVKIEIDDKMKKIIDFKIREWEHIERFIKFRNGVQSIYKEMIDNQS